MCVFLRILPVSSIGVILPLQEEMVMQDGKRLEDLTSLVETLRGPNGCPWDREQTLSDLKSYLMGEAYELLDAMDRVDDRHIREEAGDLLFIIIFLVDFFREKGTFTIYDVIGDVMDKMIRRHPHVFAGSNLDTAQAVSDNWLTLKAHEGKPLRGLSILDGVADFLPELVRAQLLTRKASEVGFDWDGPSHVLQKIEEELAELQESIARREQGSVAKEVGDVLFSVVNLARLLGVDAEQALRKTNTKFLQRFHFIEESVRAAGGTMKETSLEQMDALWEKAKKLYP